MISKELLSIKAKYFISYTINHMIIKTDETFNVYKRAISKNLKQLLKTNAMSILSLSTELKISYGTVYKMTEEGANPTLDTLIKVSEYFNISVGQLIGEVLLEEKAYKNFVKCIPIISWSQIKSHLLNDKNSIASMLEHDFMTISSEKLLSDMIFAVLSNINTEPLFRAGTLLIFDILLSDIRDFEGKFLLVMSKTTGVISINKLIINNKMLFLQSINSIEIYLFNDDEIEILAYLVQARIDLDNR